MTLPYIPMVYSTLARPNTSIFMISSTAGNETIVAIATPPGKGAVGIVRLSGPRAMEIAGRMIRRPLQSRTAVYTPIIDDQGDALDQGLAIAFPAPGSYTGEDMVELHAHGADMVLREMVRCAVRLGARQARPGEFTERAFLNEKLDLIQAEAVADLIESHSLQAARNASLSLQGRFSTDIDEVLSAIIEMRAFVESALDFPEEDIDFLADGQIKQMLQQAIEMICLLLSRSRQGKQLREGKRIVIAGRPNVGKSSLMNQLSGYSTSIVSDVSGTTRDLVEQQMSFSGVIAQVTDTAGLRETSDPVEIEGVNRAREALGRGDIIIHVNECHEDPVVNPDNLPPDSEVLRIYNKIDLHDEKPRREKNNPVEIYLSAKTGAGIELLQEEIARRLLACDTGEPLFLARQRHLDAMENARRSLVNGLEQLHLHGAGELLAEDLLQAQRALSGLKGEFLPDDLLGEIFSRFCIGK